MFRSPAPERVSGSCDSLAAGFGEGEGFLTLDSILFHPEVSLRQRKSAAKMLCPVVGVSKGKSAHEIQHREESERVTLHALAAGIPHAPQN